MKTKIYPPKQFLGATLLGVTLWIAALPMAMAEDEAASTEASIGASVSTETEVKPEEKEPEKVPYRGTSVSYTNVLSAISLKKDADLDYNPYHSMGLSFAPMWWFSDIISTSVSFGFDNEVFTNSDSTSKRHETVVSDLGWSVGAKNFYTIPVVEIGLSASLGATIPTSKNSQARTLIMGLKPKVSISRNFEVLKGLSISYSFGATKNFHYYTTAQKETSPYQDSDSFQSFGTRNTEWQTRNGLSLSLAIVDWLSFSTGMAWIHNFIYKQEDSLPVATSEGINGKLPGTDENIKQERMDVRYMMSYHASIDVSPMPAFGISLGFQTANPMLGIDGKYEPPVFNRYTVVMLNMSLNVAGLVSQLTSNE